MFPLMFTSHLALPRAPKLSPDASTMRGMFVLSSFCIFIVLYIARDMTLFMAPVSNKVFILSPFLPFAMTGKTVPEVEPNLHGDG